MLTAQMLCQNQLLAVLPEEERTRLAHDMKLVSLSLDQSLYEPGCQIRHVYFPTSAIVSLRYELENGSLAEIAVVGREGVVGIALFMGGETTLSRSVVEKSGQAFQLEGYLLKREFHRAGPMQRILMRYTQASLTEMAQTLVCIRHHSLDQQLCRWLLRRFERFPHNSLMMSQEKIANILGVRRGAISEVAVRLQKAALISYNRGRITLLDRHGMEMRSCECYAIVRDEFDRLLTKATIS
ncbi:MAG: Crp/Fnr family transcriptional regulator [Betaproteobacteria bacterium]